MDIELLKKYCQNKCSNEELLSVLDWFANSTNSQKSKALLLELWEVGDDADLNLNIDFDHLLDSIHHKIDLSNSKNILENSHHNSQKFYNRRLFMSILRNAAALLLLPILGFGLFMSSKYYSLKQLDNVGNQVYHEVFSSEDAISSTILPDGSKVWLNHNSSLKYPATFIGSSRAVELNGEGYFEVTPNSKKPFIVKAGGINVYAHGTAFNILAYPEEEKIETSLINGIVELHIPGQSGKSNEILELKPMEIAVYDKLTHDAFTGVIVDDRYYAWKEGKLVFSKAPMDEVVRKLNRWFNVDIQIHDIELRDITLTATFVNETLPEVLNLIGLVTPISHTISSRESKEDGTFTKRKVILYYRKKSS